MFSADGSRALILTTASSITGASSRMAVINTATGRQVGATVTLDQTLVGSPVVGADGSHVFVLTSEGTNSQVKVLNTTTRPDHYHLRAARRTDKRGAKCRRQPCRRHRL